MKTAVSKEKFGVCVVVDYADTGFSIIAIGYLRENENFVKPFLPVHMGPRSNCLSQKNSQKSRDTVPLKATREKRRF